MQPPCSVCDTPGAAAFQLFSGPRCVRGLECLVPEDHSFFSSLLPCGVHGVGRGKTRFAVAWRYSGLPNLRETAAYNNRLNEPHINLFLPPDQTNSCGWFPVANWPFSQGPCG